MVILRGFVRPVALAAIASQQWCYSNGGRATVSGKNSTRCAMSTSVPSSRNAFLRTKPGPKGSSRDLIRAVVEMKKRNSAWGCPQIADGSTSLSEHLLIRIWSAGSLPTDRVIVSDKLVNRDDMPRKTRIVHAAVMVLFSIAIRFPIVGVAGSIPVSRS